MRIGVLCSRVRVEEKMIFAALRERGVDYERVDARKVAFELGGDDLGRTKEFATLRLRSGQVRNSQFAIHHFSSVVDCARLDHVLLRG